MEWERWTSSLCSTQAAPRQEAAQLQLYSVPRNTQKPLHKGWQAFQLCLENTCLTDHNQTKGNATPIEATSSFRVMPRHTTVPSLNLCNCKSRGTPPFWTSFTQLLQESDPSCLLSLMQFRYLIQVLHEKTVSDASKLKRLAITLQISPRKNGIKISCTFYSGESLARVSYWEQNGLPRWGKLCGPTLCSNSWENL